MCWDEGACVGRDMGFLLAPSMLAPSMLAPSMLAP